MKKYLLPLMVMMFGIAFGVNTVNAEKIGEYYSVLEGVCVIDDENTITAVVAAKENDVVTDASSLSLTAVVKYNGVTQVGTVKPIATTTVDCNGTSISAANTTYYKIEFAAKNEDVRYDVNGISVNVNLKDGYYTEQATIRYATNNTASTTFVSNNYDYDAELKAAIKTALGVGNYELVSVSNGTVTVTAVISTIDGSAKATKNITVKAADYVQAFASANTYEYGSIGHVVLDDLVQAIEDKINDLEMVIMSKDNIGLILNTTDQIEKDTLEEIQEQEYTATVSKYDADDKVEYAWTFNGTAMKIAKDDFTGMVEDGETYIDLGLSTTEIITNAPTEAINVFGNVALYLSFTHDGILPTGTTVKINVSDTFKDGDVSALYYYNDDEDVYEKVYSNLTVVNGFVSFNINHGGEYVFVNNGLVQTSTGNNNTPATPTVNIPGNNTVVNTSNNAQTSSMDTVMYSTMSITSLIGIGYLLISKKRIA